MQLRNIPIGTTMHNVELKPGKGGQLARSAGGSAQLAAREGMYATMRLRSTEMRKVHVDCRATIGEVGNDEHNLRSYGKAGAKRWRGIRPTVRGVVMNPVDHPHGGGEGKSGQGNPHPVQPVGLEHQGQEDAHATSARPDMIIRAPELILAGAHSASFSQERSVRRPAPREEGASRRRQERSPSDQDLVAPLDDPARHGRPDDRRA